MCFTQELLESIKTLKVEERDTDSLQIIEKERANAACTSASVTLLLHGTEDEGDSAICKWAQEDTEDVPGDMLTDVQQTDLHAAPLAFASGYTTMETFRQAMAQEVSLTTWANEGRKPEGTDVTAVKSGLDYVRQCGNIWTCDSWEPAHRDETRNDNSLINV